MSDDPVSNHDLAIVTDGTKHKFVTDDDHLYNPKDSSIEVFENYIYSEGNLQKGKTERTTIAGHAICTTQTRVGPDSDPDQTPTGYVLGERTKKPHRGYAKGDTGSKDVRVEDHPVMRSTDPTYQNARDGLANGHGIVDGSEVSDAASTELSWSRQRCSILRFHGLNGARRLGPQDKTSTTDDYIEILTSETMYFDVHRVDTSKDPVAPADTCLLVPRHTIWNAFRSGYGGPASLVGQGDKFELTKDFTRLPLCQSDKTTLGAGYTKKGEVKSTDFSSKNNSTTGLAVSAGAIEVQSAIGTVSVDWAGFMNVWRFRKPENGTKIVVTATTCANTRTATVRLFPQRAARFEIEIPAIANGVQEAIQDSHSPFDELRQYLMDFHGLVEMISGWIGVDASFDFVMFDGFYGVLEAQYLPCTREVVVGQKWKGVNHCGLRMYFEVGCTTILGMTFEIRVPLASFVVKAVPGFGPGLSFAIKKLEKAIEIEFGVKLTVGCAFGLAATIEHDQHGVFPKSGNKLAARLELTIGLGLYFKVVGLTGDVGIVCKPSGEVGLAPCAHHAFCHLTWGGKVATFFTSSLQYKGKFSQVATAALVGVDTVRNVGSKVLSLIRGSEGGPSKAFLNVSDSNARGERTVSLNFNKPLKEWTLPEKEVEL